VSLGVVTRVTWRVMRRAKWQEVAGRMATFGGSRTSELHPQGGVWLIRFN